MPSYAFLFTPVTCPFCTKQLTDEIWFQWGYCIDRSPSPETSYSIGDRIRWRALPNGTIPAWTYFFEKGLHAGGNIGSPDVQSLIVRDMGQTWLHEPCPSCGHALGGGALEIHEGRIVRGWLAPADLFTGTHAYWSVAQGNQAPPMPWGDDHDMAIVEVSGSENTS